MTVRDRALSRERSTLLPQKHQMLQATSRSYNTNLNQNMHVVTWGSHPEAVLKESHKEALGKNTSRLKHCTDCSSTPINAVYC